jgi:hypothetical protein
MNHPDALEGEVFRQIAGFERYWVSNLGRVWSTIRAGRFLAQPTARSGYPYVTLMADGAKEGKKKNTHRILAEAFIPNPMNLPTVNHKDGNKTHCVEPNLEWSTYGANNDHARDHGLVKNFGAAHYAAKLIDDDVIEIRRLVSEGRLHREVAECFGVNRQQITRIVNRQAWART